jgi:undecaprenyl-diphosphatase
MMSMLGYVVASDCRLSDRMLDWTPPRWFRIWMLSATRLGDGWLWLSALVVLAAGGSECQRALAAAAVAAVLANIVLVLVKGRVRRPRPCDVIRHRSPQATLRYLPSDRYSFPSGHSLNAFALGSVLALFFPALGAPLLFVAANVAASRVVLGRHFLSDVLAGSALGALIGGVAFVVFLI